MPRTDKEKGFFGVVIGQGVCAITLDMGVFPNGKHSLPTFDLYVVSRQSIKGIALYLEKVLHEPRSYSIPVSRGLFVLGLGYQAILSLDALRRRKSVHMYNTYMPNVLLLGLM